MYVAIEPHDIRRVNDSFKWVDFTVHCIDTVVLHTQYDTLTSHLRDEFAISVVGVNGWCTFEVIDELKFVASCNLHKIAYKVISEDEIVWGAAPKEVTIDYSI